MAETTSDGDLYQECVVLNHILFLHVASGISGVHLCKIST